VNLLTFTLLVRSIALALADRLSAVMPLELSAPTVVTAALPEVVRPRFSAALFALFRRIVPPPLDWALKVPNRLPWRSVMSPAADAAPKTPEF
jgi:hypothetical protein